MANPFRTIFVFSLEPWGDMWYSKHHYAAFLGKSSGVYFISLPDRWRWSDLLSFGVKVKATSEGVNVLEYRNNLPLRILPRFMRTWVDRLNAWKLSRLPRSKDALFWCFYPTSLLKHEVLRSPGTQVVYHVVDPYLIFPNDPQFAKMADLVVAINPWYKERYQRINPNTVLIPHGVRSKDRRSEPAEVERFRARWGPYIVIAAGINQHTNYPLLLSAAKHFPGHTFVLVGPLAPLKDELSARRNALLSLPNVLHDGIKHPDELRNLIRGAEIGLVTYEFEPTRSLPTKVDRTPLKVITYLAQHCPVVSTINSYIPELDGHGNFKAEDATHFLDLMERILNKELGVDSNLVDAYLDGISYEQLTKTIINSLPIPLEVPGNSLPEQRFKVPKSSPVLIISNDAWIGPRYSKHRYALALAETRKVLFLDPARPWRPIHPFRWKIHARDMGEGVTVLSYFNTIPLLGGRLGGLNDRMIALRLKYHFRKAGLGHPLFWSFDPSRLTDPAQLDAVLSVYHCADDYSFGWGERSLAEKCDHVFCIARELMPRFRTFNRSTHFLPHGLTKADLVPASFNAEDLPVPAGYGLYIGNINDRHNFTLWKKLFTAHPDITWLIVGPVNVTAPAGIPLLDHEQFPNVMFYGELPYDRLRTLIAGASFGFVYLNPETRANRISCQKVVQFLTQGKPFFCSWFSEYADKQDLLYMTDSDEDALAVFAAWRGVPENPDLKLARRSFAGSLQFDKLLSNLPFEL